jgi:F-type H+-transporting ATPase subunit b
VGLLLVFAGNAIQLVPDGTLVFHLVVIILMVGLLNATLLKPINQILEERDRRTRGRLSEAEGIMLTVEEKLREYERQLRDARSEGYSLMEKERVAVSGERERKVAEVKSQIAQELNTEKDKLRDETERVKVTLIEESRELAMEISRQILHRPVTGQQTTS